MKKIALLILIVFSLGCFSGCEAFFNIIINNMSDLRINYFEGKNENVFVNISCGYREEIFNYDGISTTSLECGVISVAFMDNCTYKSIQIILNVNGVEKEYTLEKSPYEDIYMEDIGKILNCENNISIKLKNQEEYINLTCLSCNWKIDYKKAVQIAVKYLKDNVESYYFNNKLNAECYLKIISKKEFENKYWYFSIIGKDGKNYSLIIDVVTGEIMSNFKN